MIKKTIDCKLLTFAGLSYPRCSHIMSGREHNMVISNGVMLTSPIRYWLLTEWAYERGYAANRAMRRFSVKVQQCSI
jgi:type II secretory pathway component PulM